MFRHLDAQSRRFLEMAAPGTGPRLEDMEIAQARAALKTTIAASGIEQCEVGACQRISMHGPAGLLTLCMYRPGSGSDVVHPVVVLLHGGGWALSDLDDYENLARFLSLRSGAVVVSVDYRLAPEHKFPAALEDSYAAVEWVASHAAELGVDAGQLAVIGDSAGGNLAAAVCQMARDRNGPRIACQVLLYPLLALYRQPQFESRRRFGNGEFFISEASIQWSIQLYLKADEQALDARASPILSADFSRLPRALIVTAGHDPLRDEGESYSRKIRGAGGTVDYRCFESTVHGFLSFAGVLDVGRSGLEYVGDWLRSCFDPGGSRPGGG